MPRKKTKLLDFSYLQWCHWSLKQRVLKVKHRFPQEGLRGGKTPPDIDGAIGRFLFAMDHPELFLDASSASKNMRLELTKLILDYPEFAAAAIYCCFAEKPAASNRKSGRSTSALVREFLLTQATVELPNGQRVDQVGASDKEIGAAVGKKYGINKVSAGMVSGERKRLEKRFGSRVDSYVDFCQKTSEKMHAPDLTAQEREQLRNQSIKAYYEPR